MNTESVSNVDVAGSMAELKVRHIRKIGYANFNAENFRRTSSRLSTPPSVTPTSAKSKT